MPLKSVNRQLSTVSLTAFLLVSLCLLPFFKYHLNPDGICYIRIAHYYAQGNFDAAVNGYWSPLLCWLLAPLYKLGMPDLVAFRLVNIAIACFVLWKINKIVTRYCSDIPYTYRVCTVACCALELLILHFNTITPDLLTLFFLLWLLDIYLSGDMLKSPLLVGLLGALLYFTKAYSFYFFCAFLLFFIITILVKRRFTAKELPALFTLALVFILLSGGWVMALYWKYHEWMLSSVSGYTLAVLDDRGIIRHPFEYEHLLHALPYPQAYFIWEDMPWVYKHSGPHILYQKDTAVYIKLILLNCKKLGFMIWGKYPFLLAGFIPLILFWVRDKANRRLFFAWPPLLKILFFVALYVSGYMLLSVEPRYIWILLIMGTVILFRLLYFVFNEPGTGNRKFIPIVAVIPFLLTTVSYVMTRINVNKTDYEMAMKIKQHIPDGSNIAGYSSQDLWNHLFMSDLHDYGGIASYKNDTQLLNDLALYRIGYIVLFSKEQYDRLTVILGRDYAIGYSDATTIILKKRD